MRNLTQLMKKLDEQVATWSVMYMKLHHYHWYVKGPHFFTLHAKFEELYGEATTYMDDIAERMLTLGGEPTSRLQEQLELAFVTEAGNEKTAEQMVTQITADFDKIMNELTETMTEASRIGDDMTEDLLNGIYQQIEKHQWMLRAFLGETNE